jgi:hypothetical protein
MWKWASFISFPRWMYEGLVINQFEDKGVEGENILAYYDFDNYNKNSSYWILLLFAIVFISITYIFLLPYKSRLKYMSYKHYNGNNSNNGDVNNPILESINTDIDDNNISTPLLFNSHISNNSNINNDNNISNNNENVMADNTFISDGCEISFHNLSYSVINKSTKEEIVLLRGISGIARKGELCCIMGSSGAGYVHIYDYILIFSLL